MIFDDIEFVKVADFEEASPRAYTVGGKKSDDKWTASLKMLDERYAKAERNCYLIVVDGNPVYVGEYQWNLATRMIQLDKSNGLLYFNHHKWKEVQTELENGRKVELFLCLYPYVRLGNRIENAAKTIEQSLLDGNSQKLVWNKRGSNTSYYAGWMDRHCLRIDDLVKTQF